MTERLPEGEFRDRNGVIHLVKDQHAGSIASMTVCGGGARAANVQKRKKGDRDCALCHKEGE